MTKVLEIFWKARLPVMMMEKIMTTSIVESRELRLNLKALIITTLDKIDSPVCWQLGEKVLLNCAAKLQPRLPDMEAKHSIPSTSETSNLRNDTTHKIKVECLEESIDTVQTLRTREHATTDGVNHLGLNTDDGKKFFSSDDLPMPSKSAPEVKRNKKQQGVPRKVLYSMTHVQASVRDSILEVICEVVKRIETNEVATIVSDMDKIETQVLDAEAANMKVAWLRAHLEAIQKRTASLKKLTLI